MLSPFARPDRSRRRGARDSLQTWAVDRLVQHAAALESLCRIAMATLRIHNRKHLRKQLVKVRRLFII